jgi:hypothetical protein
VFLVSVITLFSALAGFNVGEGLTSATPGAAIDAGQRMFTTITGPEACNAVAEPHTMDAKRIELSVGDEFSLSDAVIDAYSERGDFIGSVPIDIFDPDPANIAMAFVDVPVGVVYKAMRHGTKVFQIRYFCAGAASVLAELFVDVRNDGEVFIDHHACPGEGCRYCTLYKAVTSVTVYEQPWTESAVVGEVQPGDTFLSKDGEVHTVPTPFIVDREHETFRPGDEVLALTYTGEGWYRVRHNGVLTEADLGFSPWGGSGGKTCNRPERCWGHLTRELEFTWWMRVITETSLEGWVVADQSMRAIDNRH